MIISNEARIYHLITNVHSWKGRFRGLFSGRLSINNSEISRGQHFAALMTALTSSNVIVKCGEVFFEYNYRSGVKKMQ